MSKIDNELLNKYDVNSGSCLLEKQQTITDYRRFIWFDFTLFTKGNTSSFTIFGYSPSQIKWSNVILLTVLHCLAIYAYIHAIRNPIKFYTFIFASVIAASSGFGMSVGGHRLWAHRSFKARLPLRLFLAMFQTITVNGSVYSYARDHRTHHKWSETEADPKNPSRGFFFSHIGWWMLKKKPQVIENGQKLKFADLLNDPILKYQHKFYVPLMVINGIILPSLIPYYAWNECLLTSFLVCVVLRTVIVLHHLFTVNSVSHFWGYRPYDREMRPTENRLVIYLSMGEGNHNYHHTFPWDYSSSEKKCWEFFNPATLFIDISCYLGFAYDLKKPSSDLVHKVVQRKGCPQYFYELQNWSLGRRIMYGICDWIIGSIIALWPVWPILIAKIIQSSEFIKLF